MRQVSPSSRRPLMKKHDPLQNVSGEPQVVSYNHWLHRRQRAHGHEYCDPHRNDRERFGCFHAGSGVTIISNPEAEYEETLAKAQRIFDAFGAVTFGVY